MRQVDVKATCRFLYKTLIDVKKARKNTVKSEINSKTSSDT